MNREKEICPICHDECTLVWSSVHAQPTCNGCFEHNVLREDKNV